MISIGNPNPKNEDLKQQILNKISINNTVEFSDLILAGLNIQYSVLDVGKGLRELHDQVKLRVYKLETLDINKFEDYPDIQMDLCENVEIPQFLKYDRIYINSILEHCYNPFIACNNLEKMISRNGSIYGYVPFLFKHHCPTDLSYQDYFRFTFESLVSLFPNCKNIEVFPTAGKIGASLGIISSSYKYVFGKKFKSLFLKINRWGLKSDPRQNSGFNFIINY